ncbi:hypothetical protein [Streptomyces gobiensis]|uniref:hypothetical protein n=1 Tax=Streptomyces gobiensis TaxID=2875706 RepID=UPI001E410325|nr:hypothetical protein [Streptomyces gobiensis]UGY92982.1 hypothetical protein test1122_15535 [Streptomyces gobiensis]
MRTSARWTGAAATVIAAVLLVSGCGSGSDEGKADKPSAGESAGTDENGGPEADAKPGTVQGIWNSEVDGKVYVLSIAGDVASLIRHDGQTCTGRVTDTGKPSLTIKCPNGGGEERTNGTVDSIEGKTMKVSWNGGDTDTYTKLSDAPNVAPSDLDDLGDLIPKG